MLAFILAVLALRPVLATLYTDPSQVPAANKYTYIIVGAGPAGSVLANRLSEDSNNKVLLIEAGPSDSVNPYIPVPFLCHGLSPDTNVNWNYTTVPQIGLGGRKVPYPRGRTLGGSSSINYMIWTVGPSSDFDRWAAAVGDSSFSWKNVQGIIKGIEALVPPADGHNTTGQIIPSIHGTNGPVHISVQGYPNEMDSKVFGATAQLSAEFPFNEDMNSGNPLGIGWTQFSVGGGVRYSGAKAYLDPIISSRSNLDIVLNAQVTKIVRTGTSGGLPVFNGVQFAQSASSSKYSFNATKEVILAAGAINTPQLLMLSGIGPSAELSSHGIPTVVDLPDVGAHLQDHVVLPNVWLVNSTFTYDDLVYNETLFIEDYVQWQTSHNGPLATGPTTETGWFRLPSNSQILKAYGDPSSGPLSPHYEFLFAEAFSSFVQESPAAGHYMMLSTNLITPTSRGTVKLASANPFDDPLIDPALLASTFDKLTIREAIKAARRFAAAPAWKGYLVGEYAGTGFAAAQTDAQIDAYASANAATVFHPFGTAFMSPASSSKGVVTPDFKVKKTHGLRIVDASVFPYIPTSHPQAAVYIFAEKAVKAIKNS
ncbi:GMC oxidoreductase [Auriscalpium vulgare]|uniref:GMC oxidoreductase n=1 Tax=Auriscalpium vulgare TaxID=40419 RepID=A0ACB8R5J5_9AGAM|nr:GMC oxidoreductase [Auriscalpium vulgare]